MSRHPCRLRLALHSCCLAFLLALLAADTISADQRGYVLGSLSFNIAFAQTACEALGDHDLATWQGEADLEAMIALCHASGQQSDCFTQYQVENGAHVSIVDGSLAPEIPPQFWEGTPLFISGRSVMIRWDLDFLFENLDVGYPVCQPRGRLFIDGFESGDTLEWSVTVSGS